MAHSKSALLNHFSDMASKSDDMDVISWIEKRIEAVEKMSPAEIKKEAYELLGKGRPANVQTTGMRR